ncbi:MAG: hypothetical protein WC333_00460 [Dehalococcoidia bacterium]|jgi:hypothetical protein
MTKAVPYIRTMGGERFKEFLAIPFSIDMLHPVIPALNTPPNEILFMGWKGKEMIGWWKFTDENKNILELYPESYKVFVKTKTYTFPIPKTLNDFINDMDRVGIALYWSEWVEKTFEPKDYLDKNEIYTYHINLLGRMGKSQELN